MNKAAIGLLRWGVVLGLLIALPAVALREKWSDAARLFVGDRFATESAASGGFAENTLRIRDGKPPTDLMPAQRPDHLPPEDAGSRYVIRANLEISPQPANKRDLRTCVYRPLGGANDQNIQRIPVAAADVDNRAIR